MRACSLTVAVFIVCLMLRVFCPTDALSKPTSGPPEMSRGPVTVGQVTSVDLVLNLMTLRVGASSITVDISSPILKGYNSVTDIKKGQIVAVRYTATAIYIERAKGTGTGVEKSVPVSPRPTKRASLPRRARTDGRSFDDVDNNKDGLISPVELSVVIPDMTMEQFRTYDKNGDGRIDRFEYGQIPRNH